MRWSAFSLLLPLAQGIALSTPPLTASQSQPSSESPSPTWALDRRDVSSKRATITTLFAPSSVCGYEYGKLSLPLTCRPGEVCLFHTSDAFVPVPGLGCCPQTPTYPCRFPSTCFDMHEVFSLTPSLLSFTTDPFALFCTNSHFPFCATRTWPQLPLGTPIIVGCATASSYAYMLTAATISSPLTSGTVMTTVVEMPSARIVDGAYVEQFVLGTTFSPTSTAPSTSPSSTRSSTSSLPSSSPPSSPSSSGGSSSTPAGVIAGSVVGAVMGVAGIAAAIAMFIILRRRQKQDNPAAAAQRPRELDATSPDRNRERVEDEGDNPMKFSEVEGSDAITDFPKAQGSEAGVGAHQIGNRASTFELQ